MLICQVIELKPTSAQVDTYHRNAAAARIDRNDLVALWREQGRRLPGFRYCKWERRPALNKAKFAEHPSFAEVSQNAVKGGYLDAEEAIARYYSGQNRRPRFLGKSSRPRFRADNGPGTITMEGKRLSLPSKAGGQVKTKERLRWPGKQIRECRVRESGGRWYASVRVEIDQAEYRHQCGAGAIGIDLGLKTFAAIAHTDGTIEKLEAPEPYRKSLKALRRANRRLSRRRKGGKNWRKAKTEVGKRHRRMASIRKDFLHQLSHRLTTSAYTIQVESLSLKGWQRRWGRKTSDLAPAEFLRQLEYKAAWRDGLMVKADWHFPSSQLCHECRTKGGKLD